MANLIPWDEFEEEYAKNFAEEIGAPALPFRMALGSLIIKEKLRISDRETVEQIKENPYLQYFIGRNHYSNEAPYDASLLVRFRERINVDLVNQINQRMVKKIQEEAEEESKKAEVYRQQQWMYDNKTSRIEERRVSLSQPHIRPIVRKPELRWNLEPNSR